MKLKTLAITVMFFGLFVSVNAQVQVQKPVDLVYPLLDAVHSRWFYFSSASRPFGMVSLFPDTETEGSWGSGYRYNVDTIQSLNHIHEWQLAGLPVMPVSYSDSDLLEILKDHSSHFSHQSETIKPGFHSLILERYQTKIELTASNRVGFHRYHFPEDKQKAVIFDLGGQQGPSKLTEGAYYIVSERELQGYVVNGPTNRRPKSYPVFFHAVFNQPIKRINLYEDGKLREEVSNWKGREGKILVEIDDISAEPLLMKIGLSYTSVEGARKNLEVEVPHWKFNETVDEAARQWDDMLGRIEIQGGSEQQQRRFYTDLWHAIQGRRQISDVDGRYSDYSGERRVIKQVPFDIEGAPDFHMYNSDSFWGAQWTLNTLWQLVYPEIAQDFIKSFLEYYRNGGLVPRGPSGGNYTYVMTGAQTTPFFVAAWQKGIRGFDIDLAYEGLKRNHLPGGIMSKVGYEHTTFKGGGLSYYMDMGYVPYPLSDTIYGMHQSGASLTLEYSYQDWVLAQLADALGKKEDYNYFNKRSENYKNQYNARSGWMQPKDIDGKWIEPFDPYQYGNGFVEANAAQASWFVPHDLEGLAGLMGGKEKAIQRLQKSFIEASKLDFTSGTSHDRETHPELSRIPINYGNQPSIQTAFIFNHLGRPDLTQYWSREVVNKAYSGLSPDTGYNGDEDQGLMGSLAVLFKIGIFQMNGGTEHNPKYELGSPVFDKITIHLNTNFFKAKTFVIETKNNSQENIYIQSAMLNGKSLPSFWLRHSDINNSAHLVLIMGNKPDDQ